FTNRRLIKTAVCKPPLLDSGSQRKFRPDRCVIGWFFSLSYFAVDSRRRASFGQRLARQDRIDPEPAILWKREHPVIPPAEESGLGMVETERVDQSDRAELL